MTEPTPADLDQLAIDTLRFLAVDMVERAQSGHPGTPMALAPLGYRLWTRFLRHDPADPAWPDRDRFILSCGHASALLYALLHLSGYDLPVEELKAFRQLGSKTPGHPEHGLTPGVETTTGPLGQGFGNAVGLALAQRILASRFNRPGMPVVDFRVWVFASDGDLMEGVASEAASLAGHHQLGRLNVFYDDNRITIDGPTELAFTEDVGERFEAYGWHVQRVDDANDLAALETAMERAAATLERPSLVVVRSHIAWGSPNKQDTAEAHGSPLGAEEVEATKRHLGWPLEPTFHIPEGAREAFAGVPGRGARLRSEWQELLDRYRGVHPDLAGELDRRLAGELPEGWDRELPRMAPGDGSIATRKASGKVLQVLARRIPELIGGSADLTGSNQTDIDDSVGFSPARPDGRNLHYGVREHAMGAAMNGMALAGLRPYGGTFLIFSDYMRPAVRLAALMELPVIYVYTHDSIFLGEDGPTHQPISQLAALRAIPHLTVLRPADANEVAAAWRVALANRRGPSALALTRQKLPVLEGTAERAEEGVARGAYVLADGGEEPRLVLFGTGSEVSLCLDAGRRLRASGIATRVVSMPSWELFAAQPAAYRRQVLGGSSVRRLAVEAAATLGWERWVGSEGAVVGLDRFGASAPAGDLAQRFGFTAERVEEQARKLLR
jgi:transketolase